MIYFLRGFRGINTDEKDTGKKDEKKFEQEKNGLGEYLNIKASILEKKEWILTSIFFSALAWFMQKEIRIKVGKSSFNFLSLNLLNPKHCRFLVPDNT